MSVMFLVSNLKCGGMERTVAYLSKYFAEHDEKTSIVCISDEKFYEISDKVDLIMLNIKSPCRSVIDRGMHIIQRYFKIAQVICSKKPDAIICVDPELIRFFWYLKRIIHFKLITSERSNPLVDSEKKTESKRKAFGRSDGIIFQTERAKDCFPKNIREKGIVIPNAVGNEMAYNIPPVSVRRKAITAAGRLWDQKDYPTLIKAFSLFYKEHPDYVLEIFGEGVEKNNLQEFAKSLQVFDQVHFMGVSQEALLSVLTSSCYVLSSKYEGMPNSLMEALAVGTPSISTDCPFGPRELITDGENGLLVPVGDSEKLAEAIAQMVDNVEFARNCGENGRKILKTNCVDTIAEKYLNYIQMCIGGK